jgi:hypothetical protein
MGCKRQETRNAVEIRIIDASRLRPAFESSTPEAQALVDDAIMSIQDSDHSKALADLAALSKTPSITESQRQVVAGVEEQIKKRAAKSR